MTGDLFEGHQPRNCGEHRTVGSHRAWCFDCGEWCYPREEAACQGCQWGLVGRPAEPLELVAELAEARRLLADLFAWKDPEVLLPQVKAYLERVADERHP